MLAAGSRSGRLLILRNGAVAIIKDAIEIAKVAEPGAVFGELSALLDQPHTAGVRWRLNWPPFRPDTRHSSEGLGISSSTCLCRTTISGLN